SPPALRAPIFVSFLALSIFVVRLGCASAGKNTTGEAAQSGSAGSGSDLAGSGAGVAGASGLAGVPGTGGATGVAGDPGGPAGAGPAGSGPAGAPGTGGTGAPTGGAGAWSSGAAGSTPTTMDASADHVCQEGMFKFEPKIPTVYLLVDRSGSMFACVGSTDVRAPPCADQTKSYRHRLSDRIPDVA